MYLFYLYTIKYLLKNVMKKVSFRYKERLHNISYFSIKASYKVFFKYPLN